MVFGSPIVILSRCGDRCVMLETIRKQRPCFNKPDPLAVETNVMACHMNACVTVYWSRGCCVISSIGVGLRKNAIIPSIPSCNAGVSIKVHLQSTRPIPSMTCSMTQCQKPQSSIIIKIPKRQIPHTVRYQSVVHISLSLKLSRLPRPPRR